MTIDLEGKVAVITGAAQGIGLGIARCLAASGAKVLLSDIQEKGGGIAKTIDQATFFRADVSREADVKNLVDVAVAR